MTRIRRTPNTPITMLAAAGLAFGHALAAQAGSHLHSTLAPQNQIFSSAAGPQLIQVGELHGTTWRVHTQGPSRLLIMLNAECTFADASTTNWVSLEILVDGVVASPTGPFQAFCSSDGDSAYDEWVMSASDAMLDVAAGLHSIEVRGRSAEPTGNWWIGDLSLIVIENEL